MKQRGAPVMPAVNKRHYPADAAPWIIALCNELQPYYVPVAEPDEYTLRFIPNSGAVFDTAPPAPDAVESVDVWDNRGILASILADRVLFQPEVPLRMMRAWATCPAFDGPAKIEMTNDAFALIGAVLGKRAETERT
jgi:hypothetical protein